MNSKSKSGTEKVLEEILSNYKAVFVYLHDGTIYQGKAISIDIQTHAYYIVTDNMVVIIPEKNVSRAEVVYQ
jgi:small nuclear ribonucleoprotein (snRNP)-like protein